MTNVRDFGAMGDGLADDTAAIEHALHDGGDGLLEFPRGEYRITRTITFDLSKTGRLAIHGSGGTAKLIMHGAGPVFEFLGHHEGSADPKSGSPNECPRSVRLNLKGSTPKPKIVKSRQTVFRHR
jgi:hypothetical protein